MRLCRYCESDELTITTAGSQWLVTCTSCWAWWHATDIEVRELL